MPLTKLNGEHVQRLLATKSAEGLASTTVRKIYSVLHAALNEAVALGLIPRNVATGVRKPRLRRVEMKAWNPEQARTFLAVAAKDRLYAMYVVALSTGLREGELMALRWRDLMLPEDGSDGALRIQHTSVRDKGDTSKRDMMRFPTTRQPEWRYQREYTRPVLLGGVALAAL